MEELLCKTRECFPLAFLLYVLDSPGMHHEHVDEKPPDKEAGSGVPWKYNNGVQLSYLRTEYGVCLLRERLGVAGDGC
ncbi:hypothetical protein AVEN_188671-1 [Araneus ventricosus]|uniref:Uncharacterized protein n=1 Tax=Araneus ventricosus TaxID=182803 RepID=A0A4Y2D921_ARAVE|nr:hypothetical protein AVEN_188671-1 [Araneus ventricosus]